MENIITIALVNFRVDWGNKESNLNRILGYIHAARRRGADLVLFPELALTGYEDDRETLMHKQLSETEYGESLKAISEVARQEGIYVALGFAEHDDVKENVVYNSAYITGVNGHIGTYRKAHLPGTEAEWATPGDNLPFLFDSPWGLIGLAICYDVYNFPETVRYVKAMGARLFLNPTACDSSNNKPDLIRKALEYHSLINTIYIASSNLAGRGREDCFIGGSSIVGPNNNTYESCEYYAGKGFFEQGTDRPEMILTTIDLSVADNNSNVHLFRNNPRTGVCDFRPSLYERMYKEISTTDKWFNENGTLNSMIE